MSRVVPHRPPKKRDRNADGWELIGFYMQRNGVVDMRDREIAAALRWHDSHGVPDADRVKTIRAHVSNKSRREREQGIAGSARVFSGWYFGYRDIKGSPSVLKDENGSLLAGSDSLFALLGDSVRFGQHTAERDRVQGWAHEAAAAATSQGRLDVALAWLSYEHDVKTFGQPQDTTVEELRMLLGNGANP